MKRAILIGVNKYKEISGLTGCVNDVMDMYHTIKSQFNFSDKEIQIITDSRATTMNILGSIASTLNQLQCDKDYFFFYFAGHGSQVFDESGDEEDFMDEILCPYDMSWDKQIYITDDQLFHDMDKSPAIIEAVFDCCHSGTQARDAVKHIMTRRYAPPPIDFSFRYLSKDILQIPRKKIIDQKKVQYKHRILWSACQDHQYSNETRVGSDIRGVFTYYLCKYLKKYPRKPRKDLIKILQDKVMRVTGYSQTPQYHSYLDV